MEEKPKTCWKTEDPLRIKYHDEEWGVPLHDDNRFFEFLALGGFQAGLTWWLVLKKRKSLREAFDNFDPRKVANYDTPDIECLMRNQGSARADLSTYLEEYSLPGQTINLTIVTSNETMSLSVTLGTRPAISTAATSTT